MNSIAGIIPTSTTITPFLVQTRKNPSNPALWQAMVNTGDLLKSLKPNDNLTITGLGAWFNLNSGSPDLIWIYIVVSSYVSVSATIQSYGKGNGGFNPTLNAWDDSGGYVQDDAGTPPSQIAANIMIAESTIVSSSPVVTQKLFNNLLLQNCQIDGEPAIFPFPSTYSRYI